MLWKCIVGGVTKGIPTLAFGFCWHEPCDSTLRYENVETTSEGLLKLFSKSKSEVLADVERFIFDYSDCFVPTTFGDIFANEMEYENIKLSQNFAKALMQIVNRPQKSKQDQ